MKENVILMYPHCDPRILHEPGACTYCDEHKDWQELREMWNIAFTGDSNPTGKIIDPAEAERPLDIINKWGGNRPNKSNICSYCGSTNVTEFFLSARQFIPTSQDDKFVESYYGCHDCGDVWYAEVH